MSVGAFVQMELREHRLARDEVAGARPMLTRSPHKIRKKVAKKDMTVVTVGLYSACPAGEDMLNFGSESTSH